MRTILKIALCAGVAALLAGSGPGRVVAEVSPRATVPDKAGAAPSRETAPEERGSGGSSEPLGEKLNRSGGVIHPPAGLDPALTQTPPAIGHGSMPVIPPPGTPGGRPDINPK